MLEHPGQVGHGTQWGVSHAFILARDYPLADGSVLELSTFGSADELVLVVSAPVLDRR
jgi:hypothetical protein